MSTYIEVEFKDISFNCVPSGGACNPYTGDLPSIDVTLNTKPGTNYDTPINVQMQPDGSGVPVTSGIFENAIISNGSTTESVPVVNWLYSATAGDQGNSPRMGLILGNSAHILDNSRVILWFDGGPGATDISQSLVFLKGDGEKSTIGYWPYTIGIIAADSSGGLGNPELCNSLPLPTFSSELKTVTPTPPPPSQDNSKGQDFWRTTLNTKYFAFPYERSFSGLLEQTYFEDFTNGYLKQVDVKTIDPYKQ